MIVSFLILFKRLLFKNRMIILIVNLSLLSLLCSLQEHVEIESSMVIGSLHRVNCILILVTVRLFPIVIIITVHYLADLLLIALQRDSTIELLSVLLVLEVHLQMNHPDLIQVKCLCCPNSSL